MNNIIETLHRACRKLKYITLLDRRHLHEVWEQVHLERILQEFKVDCVFDVGANQGQYAQMLRKQVGFRGLIVSFEPNPDAAAVAREHAQGDSKWLVEESAISSRDGEQIFNVMSGTQFSSFSSPRHDETTLFRDKNIVSKQINVRTETLSTAFLRLQTLHQFKRPFLKLDTQGHDVEIISRAGQELGRFIGLQSELAIKKLYESSVDFREAISIYEKAGFELSAFVPNNRGHFPRLIETDCIMLSRPAVAEFLAATN